MDDAARLARARESLPVRLAQHDRRAGGDHGQLLGGDRLSRLAQDVGVVERDVGQGNDLRLEDVGRIQSAAQAGLHHRDLDSGRGELGERGGGQHLELRRPEPLGGGPRPLERLLEVGVLAVHLHPLRPAADMRRGVGPHAQPLAREKRGGAARGG